MIHQLDSQSHGGLDSALTADNSVDASLLYHFLQPEADFAQWLQRGTKSPQFEARHIAKRADGSLRLSFELALGLALTGGGSFAHVACSVMIVNDGIYADLNTTAKIDDLLQMHSGLISDPSGRFDARAVYGFLETKEPLGLWFTNSTKCAGLHEGVDFWRESVSTTTGKRVHLTLTSDGAAQLAMMAHTKRGRQVIRYFLNCEEMLIPDPVERERNWMQLMRGGPLSCEP